MAPAFWGINVAMITVEDQYIQLAAYTPNRYSAIDDIHVDAFNRVDFLESSLKLVHNVHRLLPRKALQIDTAT